MAQGDKAALWAELKEAGVEFSAHYREYSTEVLQAAVDRLHAGQRLGVREQPADEPGPVEDIPPFREPDTEAGLRINSHAEGQPIRTDENGLIWYQDEVRKSAFPKPRGRRVLKYNDPGFVTQTVKMGDYTESFEMPGNESRPMEARITLPSYQVGIYKDPRFPFKIHTYNDSQGFDLFDVRDFYGGADMVPDEIKRVYVENSLCYDMRTTIRAIQSEYREKILAKEIAE